MALDRMDFTGNHREDLVARFREAFLGTGKVGAEETTQIFKRVIEVIDNAREGDFDMDTTLELAYHITTPRYFECESLVKLGRKMYVCTGNDAYVGIGFMADEFKFDGERVIHTTLDGAERYKTSFDLVKLRNDLAEFVGMIKCDEGVNRVVVMFNDRNDLAQICS